MSLEVAFETVKSRCTVMRCYFLMYVFYTDCFGENATCSYQSFCKPTPYCCCQYRHL